MGSDTTAQSRSQQGGDPFSIRLKDYLGAASAGKDGYEFWCKATVDNAESLIAVRSTKLLAQEDSDFVQGKIFTVQIESSNKGGAPIVKNWYISMTTESDGKPCVKTLSEKN